MALIFVDGFDHYTDDDGTDKYESVASFGIDTAAGDFRSGLGALNFNASNGQITVSVPNQVTYIVGFGFRLSTPQTLDTRDLVSFNEDSPATGTHVTLQLTGDKKFRVILGNDVDFLGELGKTTDRFDLNDGFHYIEFKVTVDDTVGSFELKFDEESILSVTGVDTRNNDANSPLGVIKEIVFNQVPGAPTDTWYDDLYICDATGSKNNDFLGDCQVTTIFPKGEGTSEGFTPSAGGSNYLFVDENPPDDDTTHVQSNVSTTRDSYDMDDVVNMTVILGVQLTLYSKFASGSADLNPLVRTSGSNFLGTTKILTAAYKFDTHVFEQEPNTPSDWTISVLNAAEFGMEVD